MVFGYVYLCKNKVGEGGLSPKGPPPPVSNAYKVKDQTTNAIHRNDNRHMLILKTRIEQTIIYISFTIYEQRLHICEKRFVNKITFIFLFEA